MTINNLGLDISIFTPIVAGKEPIRNITEELNSYSHTLGSDWLYKSASITFITDLLTVGEWIAEGLGRHVEAKNQAGVIRFAGFVDEIEIKAGNVSYRVGPLLKIANRVMAVYTLKAIVESFVTNSGQTSTDFAEDSDSQDKFGIWEKVIQAGQCIVDPVAGTNEAEDARNLYLMAYETPQVLIDLVSGGEGSGVSITLTIRGYHEWLTAYIYQDRAFGTGTAPATTTVTTKIQTILGADPNGIFSTDYSKMQACGGLTIDIRADTDYKYALSAVESLVKQGDGVSRWVLQFDGDRRAILRPISTAYKYAFSLTDNVQQFLDYETGAVIDPWDVLPGYYYEIRDSPAGFFTGTGVDPNRGFIEEVNFDAPYQVAVSGEPFNEFQAFVNQKAGGNY